MCVIIAAQTRRPELAELKDAESANSHGGAIAWVNNGMVEWSKGLTAQEIYEVSKKIELPYIIHFRIASIGPACKPLCHPFPIAPMAQTDLIGRAYSVLFHNGSWFDWQDWMIRVLLTTRLKMPGGIWSDTRAMAWLAYHANGAQIFKLLDGSKTVIFDGKGHMRFSGEGWTIEKGIRYSNTFFRHTYVPVREYEYESKWNREQFDNYNKKPIVTGPYGPGADYDPTDPFGYNERGLLNPQDQSIDIDTMPVDKKFKLLSGEFAAEPEMLPKPAKLSLVEKPGKPSPWWKYIWRKGKDNEFHRCERRGMDEAELKKLREDFDKAAAASRAKNSNALGFVNNDKALATLARRLREDDI